ncbi:C3HC4 finger protein [Aspergillus glaucus CBS 516.65]|uniref:RING-type domain-containing protein n=1 Tax=Aspergillus glaucus CBS 516.65 TaxID=1160497 RepID=A0A1L9V8N4_ASPGL|nr:hypothetical protein ASPGLDRAFT_39212 [Aspergillus glaucus CBS 516.65]OJJ80212.1 hypothetical protein ASPGLDRAFT_39212 [Aspergillus glaucus CBS 516.65]
MEETATGPSGQYAEDPMLGSSGMAIPQGTAVAGGNPGPSNPLSQPFQNLAIDSPSYDQPPSPNYSFPRQSSLQPPTEFLEQWQRLVRREAIRRGFEIRVQDHPAHGHAWYNPNMLRARSPLEWRDGGWVRVEPPARNGPCLDNMGDGRPDAKESSEMMIKLECKICMSQLVDTVIIPCGHAVLCQWCADLHIPATKNDPTRPVKKVNCPICRAVVMGKYRIFLT